MADWRKWTDPPPARPPLAGDFARYCVRCDRTTGWEKDETGLRSACGSCGLTLATELSNQEYARMVERDQTHTAAAGFRLV